ncbi:MAG: TVP38/TMEM64 family protein, partial [Desulfobacterales bacterium]
MKNKMIQRIAIVAAIGLLIALFKIFELERYLSLSYLKSSREAFAALYVDHRLSVIAVYMAIYIGVTALSLPGAVVMT